MNRKNNVNSDDIVLEVSGLHTHIDAESAPLRVVDDISFSIRRGETFALLGESGCGKSMTALSLMRLLPPRGNVVAGRVLLNGVDILRLSERQMRSVRGGQMAMIFQEPMTSLNPVMSVGDQIAEAVRLHEDIARSDIRPRVIELLRDVGIPIPHKRVDEYPHQLSGGMKQRVMIAMALAGRPDVLIADEPTTALDVTIQAQVLDLMHKLQETYGMAILMITHDLGVVAEIADHLAVMYAGHLVEQANAHRFFKRPAHPYSRNLLQALPKASKRAVTLSIIKGQVSPLDRVYSHCRFLDRCDRVLPVCRERMPGWQSVGDDHRARCLLPFSEQNLPDNAEPESVAEQPSSVETTAVHMDINDLKVHFPIRKGLLKRTIGYVKAVDGVSLSLQRGQTVALVGESGSGKTTVGKAVLQLLRPTAGKVTFDGEELTRLSDAALRPYRKHMQIVFQDPMSSMNPRMLVEDIVAEGLHAQKLVASRQECRERVAELLSLVGIPADAALRYPHEFSGGQRQRICIARALAVNPEFIVCDEPTSALDVSVQAQILNLLKDLQHRLDLSYLFITHDLSVVSWLADEVAVMYLGRLVEKGPVAEILERPRHPYTRALLSAVPQIDQDSGQQKIKLEGDMPSPVSPPDGCHFHPRCPDATAQCRVSYPDEISIGTGHVVSCINARGQ